jgi:signal peptidase I
MHVAAGFSLRRGGLMSVAPTRRLKPAATLLSVLALLVATFAVRKVLVDINRIPSASMCPTLLPGDFILVNRLAFGLHIPFIHWHTTWSAPARGELVVFIAPGMEKCCVKRVVGLPGEQITVEGRQFFVPRGQYFVMGDNRDQSVDSRCFGCVEETRIMGRATTLLISFDPANHCWPRWSRFGRQLN